MSEPGPSAATSRLRLAELIAAISLATDLGMGQPMEQALRTCLIAVGLGDRVGLGREELSDVYYVALLRYLGCTADAYETARLVGGDDIDFRLAVAPVYGATTRRSWMRSSQMARACCSRFERLLSGKPL